MAIGIVSSDEFDLELAKLTPHHNQPINTTVKQIEHGRAPGDNAVPQELRKIISEEANQGTPAAELTKVFDVSPSSISAYKHGATSTASYNKPDDDLIHHRNDVRLKISTKATNKILLAMKHITEEKLANAKVRDLASVAKDMSVVARNMDGDQITQNQQNNQFIFYAPKSRDESEFDIIPVNK